MEGPDHRGRSDAWDPVGFLLLIFLLAIFGSAILFVIRWVAGILGAAS